MKKETQDKLWAMLTPEEKNNIAALYFLKGYNTDYSNGSHNMLGYIFGHHNLTSKSDETTQKSPSEPKYKIGDWVLIKNYGKFYDRIGRISHIHGNSLDVEIPNITEVEMFSMEDVVPYHSVEPYTEPKEETNLLQNVVSTNESEKNGKTSTENEPNPTENGNSIWGLPFETANSVETSVNYAQYRLDLAKDIAVALINTSDRHISYGYPLASDAVKIANEIVEQLKETEECDV